jgi:type IV pilus assembly protein PilA
VKKQLQKGFTLIELMIVVAIIGILAAIAIPAYQDYIARAQVSDAVQLLGGLKTPLAEYYADKGVWPTATMTEVGANTSGKYVQSVAISANAGASTLTVDVTATFKAANVSKFIQGKTLLLRTEDGGKIWSCTSTSGTVENKYRPAACRSS